jgi:hypothetical protein
MQKASDKSQMSSSELEKKLERADFNPIADDDIDIERAMKSDPEFAKEMRESAKTNPVVRAMLKHGKKK